MTFSNVEYLTEGLYQPSTTRADDLAVVSRINFNVGVNDEKNRTHQNNRKGSS